MRKRKEKCLRMSDFTLLLVVFKWHPGSERVKPASISNERRNRCLSSYSFLLIQFYSQSWYWTELGPHQQWKMKAVVVLFFSLHVLHICNIRVVGVWWRSCTCDELRGPYKVWERWNNWLGEMELRVGSNTMIHFLYILLFLIWHMHLHIIHC